MNADGNRTPVDGGFVLGEGRNDRGRDPRRDVGLQLAKYDHSRELVIDPVVGNPRLLDLHRRDASSRARQPRAIRRSHRRQRALTVAETGLDVALDLGQPRVHNRHRVLEEFSDPRAHFQPALRGANSPPNAESQRLRRKVRYTTIVATRRWCTRPTSALTAIPRPRGRGQRRRRPGIRHRGGRGRRGIHRRTDLLGQIRDPITGKDRFSRHVFLRGVGPGNDQDITLPPTSGFVTELLSAGDRSSGTRATSRAAKRDRRARSAGSRWRRIARRTSSARSAKLQPGELRAHRPGFPRDSNGAQTDTARTGGERATPL